MSDAPFPRPQTPDPDLWAELQESRRMLDTLMNNLPGMVYRNVRVAGRWKPVFVSRGIVQLLGYTPEEFTTRRDELYARLFQPDDRERMWRRIARAMADKTPFQATYRVTTAEGRTKWVRDQGEVIFDDAGEPAAMEGIITDVSDEKRIELDLAQENRRLKSAIRERYRFGDIIGKSDAMQAVYEQILKAAASDANVIVSGESGTGKELVAREIHRLSRRRDGAFVAVNCGALPANLMESEFFGYRKGAFTGAHRDTPGYLDAAHGGTLFLDELGDVGPALQVKLLRVLENRGYRPVGGTTLKRADVRIVAATNRDMGRLVAEGRMREDFFYRIHVLPIHLPPLRERRDDLFLLVDHFMRLHAPGHPRTTPRLPADVAAAVGAYDWPGNVRQLENLIQRTIAFGDIEGFDDLLPAGRRSPAPPAGEDPPASGPLKAALAAYEARLIRRRLERHRWHRLKTAADLGITPRTLFRKMKLLGIE